MFRQSAGDTPTNLWNTVEKYEILSNIENELRKQAESTPNNDKEGAQAVEKKSLNLEKVAQKEEEREKGETVIEYGKEISVK